MKIGKAIEFIKDNTQFNGYEVYIFINGILVMYGRPNVILQVMGVTYYNMPLIRYDIDNDLKHVTIISNIDL